MQLVNVFQCNNKKYIKHLINIMKQLQIRIYKYIDLVKCIST